MKKSDQTTLGLGLAARASSTGRSSGKTQAPVLTGSHTGFEVHAQTLGDSVDIIEVRNHLSGIADGLIRKVQLAEFVDVVLRHVRRGARELRRVIAERTIRIAEFGLAIVRLDLPDPLVVFDLGPEVPCMGLRSVMTSVDFGDDHGEHFALGA